MQSLSPSKQDTVKPQIKIDDVHDDQFPEVTVELTVTNPNGLPADGLALDEFTVLEEGQLDGATLIRREKLADPPARLMLIIDRSTPVTLFPRVRTVISAFITDLSNNYEVALFSLNERGALIQDFTDKKDELLAQMNDLQAQGNWTAFNDAIVEALAAFDKDTSSKNAIIIVTNFGDNFSNASALFAANAAKAQAIPIHTIGYSNLIREKQLTAISDETGGQVFIVKEPEDILPKLQALVVSQQQRYRLTFSSTLTADNRAHNFTVELNQKPTESNSNPSRNPLEDSPAANGTFQATSQAVNITLSGLADGQVVTDTLRFDIVPDTNAPLAEIQYWLDGVPISSPTTTCEQKPCQASLNPETWAPGNHTLTIKVKDTAGNEDEVSLDITVPQPLEVNLVSENKQADEGLIIVGATVEPANRIDSVSLFVNGTPEVKATAPPYRLEIQADGSQDEDFTIEARVRDDFGRTVEKEVQIQARSILVTATPTATPTRSVSVPWQTLARLGLLLLGLLLILGLMFLILTWQLHRVQVWYQIGLHNLGNVASKYDVWAQSTYTDLDFYIGGQQLEKRSMIENWNLTRSQLKRDSRKQTDSTRAGNETYEQTRMRTTHSLRPDERTFLSLAVYPSKAHLYQGQTCTFTVYSEAVEPADAPIEHKGQVDFRPLSLAERWLIPIITFAIATMLIVLLIAFLWRLVG
ncbi:MAG: VWA domain-containing protein [Chloroflexota bacterium]